MKFQFKIQQYQTDAVNSVVNIFDGQPYQERVRYVRDLGKQPKHSQLSFSDMNFSDFSFGNAEDYSVGFENARLQLNRDQILLNIQNMQGRNNIKQSERLLGHLGACSLDVEMETGTGKTYVYIKTIFELNKRYGWSKFIVVVPSIAIREGVYKTFQITEDHFMEYYGKKARFFIYNSKNLPELDNFSSSAGINVMIINIQAFNARGADSRRIREELDDFGSRKPIDVIAANRPILILDEPQKMGGAATQDSLEDFNPLFSLNYSATHKDQHNPVYVLDAVDAFNKRLVKKIEVKGFELKNYRGTDQYLFLENIIISPNKPPQAKIEFEIGYQKSINRESRICSVGSDLYALSQNMEQYKGYTVSEIDPIRGVVFFTNGEAILRGEVIGDVSENDMRRIQIRETIISHFEKERKLFALGIKTLSLFFIDEVAKYRLYDENGEEMNGLYGVMFEQEYTSILNDYLTLFEDEPYQKYLRSIEASETHKGYYSIDKKGHAVDSSTRRGSDESDNISAYDLILKNKELLLSFDNPVRFIFSHSALREGWDNPNVFQICTLKHGGASPTQKRQEVGRGLRLCVDQKGERMDAARCGDTVHSLNLLTVIASEGYSTFVSGLQDGIKEALYDRPSKATTEYFIGKTVMVGEQPVVIDAKQAKDIFLIIGPPGTGKTSYGLVNLLKEELLEEGTNVLLLSYTNRAVDEICSKLVEIRQENPDFDFIRLGSELSCSKEYLDYMLSVKSKKLNSANAVMKMIQATRVFCGTTASLNANISLLGIKHFSLAIVDESSQILEPHLIGLFSAQKDNRCRIEKFVLIGDHKQLPAVVQQTVEESAVSEPELIGINLRDCRLSLFERLLVQFKTDKGYDERYVYMLTKQGRMHRDIAEFPNQAFYGNKLDIVPLEHQTLPTVRKDSANSIITMLTTHRIAFVAARPTVLSPSAKTNKTEAQMIAATVRAIYELTSEGFDKDKTVGVIVPYRNQISTVRNEIDRYGIPCLHDITIDTVERYQGSQRDFIIYGFTIQQPYQLNFLTNDVFEEDGMIIDRKLNVALTRARLNLILIGNPVLLNMNITFSNLLDYVRAKGGYIDVTTEEYCKGVF